MTTPAINIVDQPARPSAAVRDRGAFNNNREVQNFAKGMAFCSPWVIGFLCFTLIPAALSLYFSFSDYSIFRSPVPIGLQNYRDLLHDPVFGKVLLNTLIYAALAVPGGMLVALGLALLLNQPIRGQALYRTIIFLPSLVPVVASSMLWLWIFNAKFGLLNYLTGLIGIDPIGWLNATVFEIGKRPNQWTFYWAMPALVFMSFWGVGHTVVIYLAGLQDVPKELYEAAEIDGANAWQRLLNVTLPMISPVIFFNLIMAIIGTWQVFTVPYIMTTGGPDRATYFYTMYLYDNAFNFQKMGYASAMAWVQLLIILSLTAISFWTSKRWVHYQGK